ncbi:hypothetical protein [Quatrionicoccus australiensis]|uniref:hypothetical protein n=1 Tax=Quatrionicoccus australiensis TaxID=138118 RepID=UPI001CFB00AA|nr:hypothetical protein [Quatrionicoccus australiensis]MCB4359514.1 hypothetical protein [Quatrionicoccus australiensis]
MEKEIQTATEARDKANQESYQPICLAYAYSVSSPSWKNDGGVNAPVSLKPCQNAMSSNIRKILNRTALPRCWTFLCGYRGEIETKSDVKPTEVAA